MTSGPSPEPSRPTVVEHDASLTAEDDASSVATGDASRPARGDASRGSGCDGSAPGRVCAWCTGPIPARARRDSVCCSVRCRQARHRFLRAVGRAQAVAPTRSLRLAYADPPYPGNAWLYRDHPDFGGEVDHAELLDRLAAYDGWALSTSAEALPAVLARCPPGVRVAAWHRGERPTASRWPLHAWEPVIYTGGRQLSRRPGGTRRVDSIVCGVAPVTTRPGRVIGAKPAAVCRWIFDLLGAAPGDILDDLFPGSGAITRAWAAFTGAEPSHPAEHDASRPARADGGSAYEAALAGLPPDNRPLPDVSVYDQLLSSRPACRRSPCPDA